MLAPCKTCPWRIKNDASVIPAYNQQKAEALRNTVGDEDGFRPIMACHNSTDDKPIPCKGYLACEGWRNLNVRLLLIKRRIENPTEVERECRRRGIKLEASYDDVLRKLSYSSLDEPEDDRSSDSLSGRSVAAGAKKTCGRR